VADISRLYAAASFVLTLELGMRFHSVSRTSRSRASASRRQLRFESLEQRSLLATFSVITNDDGGPGSLRQAVLDANANPGPDVIDFVNASSFPYLLTIQKMRRTRLPPATSILRMMSL
jgi:hypothetical protein